MEILIKSICILLVFGGCFADSTYRYLGGRLANVLDILFSDYNNLERPGAYYGNAPAVKIQHRYDLMRIVDFDVHKQVLTLDVWEWMQWKDERLVWDKGPLDMIRITPLKIWMPDLEIFNSAAPVVETLQKCHVLINRTGVVTYIPARQIKTYCDVDDHIAAGDLVACKITIGSWTYNADEVDVQLTGDGEHKMGTKDFSDSNRNWAVESTSVERVAKKYECCPEQYVTLNYVINLKRKNHLLCP